MDVDRMSNPIDRCDTGIQSSPYEQTWDLAKTQSTLTQVVAQNELPRASASPHRARRAFTAQ